MHLRMNCPPPKRGRQIFTASGKGPLKRSSLRVSKRPNGCLAEASDYAIIYSGSCKSDRLAQTICTKQYQPVCGEKDGVRRTLGNECEVREAGFVFAAEGEC